MDPARLPRQVINSQATAQGKCSRNVASTKRAYKMALEKVGLFEKGNSMKITTNLWIDCLTKNTDTSDLNEANLGLTQGSFKKGKKGERRKNT
jgi:hypothetical protein